MAHLVLRHGAGGVVDELKAPGADHGLLRHLALEEDPAVPVLQNVAGLQGHAVVAAVELPHSGRLLEALEVRRRSLGHLIQGFALLEGLDGLEDAEDQGQNAQTNQRRGNHAAQLGVGDAVRVFRVVEHLDFIALLVAAAHVVEAAFVLLAVYSVGKADVVLLLALHIELFRHGGDPADGLQVFSAAHKDQHQDTKDDQHNAHGKEEPGGAGVAQKSREFVFHVVFIAPFFKLVKIIPQKP